MSDPVNQLTEHPETTEAGTQEPSYVPASVYKRVWAWVGVVYMVLATLLVTYFIATTTFLHGIGGIMIFPLLAGFCVVKGIQFTRLDEPGEKYAALGFSVLSGILAVIALVYGIHQVISLF